MSSPARIMIVEDEQIVAEDIRMSLDKMGYAVCAMASEGPEAINKAQDTQPDLILMDIMLSGDMDGINAAERIRAHAGTPVVFLTAYADSETLERAKITGPSAYIMKPFQDRELHIAIEIALYKHQAEMKLRQCLEQMEKNLKAMIDLISATLELRSHYLPGHNRRVAKLAAALAQNMGLANEQIEAVKMAAHVYDIGLLGIPIEIIQVADQLDGIKLNLFQTYPKVGYDLLKTIDFSWPIAEIILQHRECFDGSGFPQGLKGPEIRIEARVLAVADRLVGMLLCKGCQNILTRDQALEHIVSGSGSQYDPAVVNACLTLLRETGYEL